VVAIDGPAASGKSTVGKRLAAELGFLYVDTGALYRAVGLKAAREGIPLEDGPALERMIQATHLLPVRGAAGMRTVMDGEDVTDLIRGEAAGFAASTVSARPEVRRALLDLQRRLGEDGGIVMDGRDIGTVIFPDAEAKFFVTASAEERGRRRWLEMREAGHPADLDVVVEEIRRRDHQDSTRAAAPLVRAPDALLIDTTGLDPDQVLSLMAARVRALMT
jgi:cytidylate kinase